MCISKSIHQSIPRPQSHTPTCDIIICMQMIETVQLPVISVTLWAPCIICDNHLIFCKAYTQSENVRKDLEGCCLWQGTEKLLSLDNPPWWKCQWTATSAYGVLMIKRKLICKAESLMLNNLLLNLKHIHLLLLLLLLQGKTRMARTRIPGRKGVRIKI